MAASKRFEFAQLKATINGFEPNSQGDLEKYIFDISGSLTGSIREFNRVKPNFKDRFFDLPSQMKTYQKVGLEDAQVEIVGNKSFLKIGVALIRREQEPIQLSDVGNDFEKRSIRISGTEYEILTRLAVLRLDDLVLLHDSRLYLSVLNELFRGVYMTALRPVSYQLSSMDELKQRSTVQFTSIVKKDFEVKLEEQFNRLSEIEYTFRKQDQVVDESLLNAKDGERGDWMRKVLDTLFGSELDEAPFKTIKLSVKLDKVTEQNLESFNKLRDVSASMVTDGRVKNAGLVYLDEENERERAVLSRGLVKHVFLDVETGELNKAALWARQITAFDSGEEVNE